MINSNTMLMFSWQVVSFQLLSQDYGKLAFLHADRYV